MNAIGHGVQPVRVYRPGSGTEGICFMEHWCGRCKHDKEWSEGKPFDECGPGESCDLIANSYAYAKDDPEYHGQWVWNAEGEPVCLRFEPANRPYRCPHTIDWISGMPG